MTDSNAALATDTARPNLSDCQHDAVIMMGLINAIDLLDNDGQHGAMTSIVSVALKSARQGVRWTRHTAN
jgi:hypothetical protein